MNECALSQIKISHNHKCQVQHEIWPLCVSACAWYLLMLIWILSSEWFLYIFVFFHYSLTDELHVWDFITFAHEFHVLDFQLPRFSCVTILLAFFYKQNQQRIKPRRTKKASAIKHYGTFSCLSSIAAEFSQPEPTTFRHWNSEYTLTFAKPSLFLSLNVFRNKIENMLCEQIFSFVGFIDTRSLNIIFCGFRFFDLTKYCRISRLFIFFWMTHECWSDQINHIRVDISLI